LAGFRVLLTLVKTQKQTGTCITKKSKEIHISMTDRYPKIHSHSLEKTQVLYIPNCTIDIPSEIEGLQYLNLTQDTIWNTARDREVNRPLTQTEDRRIQEGQSKEVVAKERF